MGFEVRYSYHEEIVRGEYNREEVKTKTVKIGDAWEDVPLDQLAGKVMAQLARRNILVVDVEIFELTKKKISFKETSDGILIKNRKFSFDDGAVVGSEEVSCSDDSEMPLRIQQAPADNNFVQQLLALLQQQQQGGNPIPQVPARPQPQQNGAIRIAEGTGFKDKAIRYEIFNPVDKIFLEDARRRKLAFKVGNKYPILRERKHPNEMVGMIYTTIDDNGNKFNLADKFFSPDVTQLERGFEGEQFKPTAAPAKAGGGDGLDWGNFVEDGVVDIRKA